MKKTFLAFAIGAALTASSALAAGIADTATVTTYSSSSTWQAGVGTPVSTDTFTGTKATFTTFNLVGGIPDNFASGTQFYKQGSSTVNGSTTVPSNDSSASHSFINAGGQWQDVVDNFTCTSGCSIDSPNVRTTTFSFTPGGVATALFGIGFTFNEGTNSTGSGALITLNFSDGSTKSVQTLSGVATDTFFGYSSTVAFSSLTISSANQGGFNQETFTLDNLGFAPNACVSNCTVVTPPSSTPEPATFSMIGAALAGLGLMARRRKA